MLMLDLALRFLKLLIYLKDLLAKAPNDQKQKGKKLTLMCEFLNQFQIQMNQLLEVLLLQYTMVTQALAFH